MSGGLVDLATALGKRAEDRDALLAVVAALALGAETQARKPAKTASLEMVRQMEILLFEAESNMLRCWAGAQCAMAHGCLRWADLHATKEAVFGVSWRMKGKKTQVPWAALREGFTGRDWGSTWLSELAAAASPVRISS